MKTEEKIKAILSEIFDINVNEISDETSLHSVEKWDSLSHMMLIVALEMEFKIKFDDVEIPTLIDYSIITATIQAYIED